MNSRIVVPALTAMFFTGNLMPQAPTDSLLGPHNLGQKGCNSCHAPHNGSLSNGGTDAATGEIFLWGRNLSTGTYRTFGGSSLTLTGAPAGTDPLIHTQLCLSCHDGGVSEFTMASRTLVGSGGNLRNDHPVHVEYTASAAGNPEFWNVTVVSGRVNFQDTAFVGGHPARLYPDPSGTRAYVECSTCHDPHNHDRAVVKVAGVNTTKMSAKFVRGWYSLSDGSVQANFCRSCHYAKSDQYDGNPK